jgi:hypothetical protein
MTAQLPSENGRAERFFKVTDQMRGGLCSSPTVGLINPFGLLFRQIEEINAK